jgi:hypothetical protein
MDAFATVNCSSPTLPDSSLRPGTATPREHCQVSAMEFVMSMADSSSLSAVPGGFGRFEGTGVVLELRGGTLDCRMPHQNASACPLAPRESHTPQR